MNRAVNLGPTPTATQEQENTADIIAFERVKALRPGVHDYDPQLYADLMRVAEMARHNTEAQKAEDAERRKNNPPGSVGAAKVPQPEPEAPKPLKRVEPTDDQLADIFAEEHRNDLRFVAAWGKWFEWTGKLWREDKTLRAFDLVRKTCKAQGVKRAGMSKLVAAVQTLARADRRLAATIEQWDTDQMLLNTPQGIVDLRDGTLRKSDPLAFCTKMTAVAPRGDCPLFLAFLKRIMGGDAELVAYLQRVCGYCLTGDTSEQAMFFNYGAGANGKSVLMATVSGILADYCVATPIEVFTESKSDRHPTELARLRGARLVTATETEAGRHWAESRLKELTGGEKIAARFMNQNFFEFQPRVQASPFRQPQATLAQCRPRHAAASKPDPVRCDDTGSRARSAVGREAESRAARYPAMDDRWVSRLAGDGPRPAGSRDRRHRRLFRQRGRDRRLDCGALRGGQRPLVALV